MPNRRNIRFLSLLISVMVLAVVIISGLVLIARTNDPPAWMYAVIVGFPGLLGVQLLQMLRTEETVKEVVETAVAPVAQEVKTIAAKLDNGGKPMQVSRDDLHAMIVEIVRSVCSEHLNKPPRVQT